MGIENERFEEVPHFDTHPPPFKSQGHPQGILVTFRIWTPIKWLRLSCSPIATRGQRFLPVARQRHPVHSSQTETDRTTPRFLGNYLWQGFGFGFKDLQNFGVPSEV